MSGPFPGTTCYFLVRRFTWLAKDLLAGALLLILLRNSAELKPLLFLPDLLSQVYSSLVVLIVTGSGSNGNSSGDNG